MEYKDKIKYAEKVAEQLQAQKSVAEITEQLKSEGLYDRDISNVMVSARNILGDQYQPQIRAHLLEDKAVIGSSEFSNLDDEMLQKLIDQERMSLAAGEKKNITSLIKEGHAPEVILQQVDTRFLSAQEAAVLINKQQKVKKENSGSGRMINIGGGIGLILLTGIILLTTDRLFYFLPIIGIVMIVKGFTTQSFSED